MIPSSKSAGRQPQSPGLTPMTIAYAVCQFTLKTVFTFSSKLNSRTEPDAPSTDAPTTDDPSTDPPCYEDIVSIDPRYVITCEG